MMHEQLTNSMPRGRNDGEIDIDDGECDELELMDERVVIPRAELSADTLGRMENSVGVHCRDVFDKELSCPGAMLVLPYKLHARERIGEGSGEDTSSECCGSSSDVHIRTVEEMEMATALGKCLLDMNRATARLSFWLMVHRSLTSAGIPVKEKVKEWIRRSRVEPPNVVAADVVTDVDCGSEYMGVCRELLEMNESVSNASSYVKDPMATACEEFDRYAERFVRCCSSGESYYVYLIDEVRGVPIKSSVDYFGHTYPLRIPVRQKMMRNVFLPFMNLTAMSAVAIDGFASLAKLLGIPPAWGIPRVWYTAKSGLVHRVYLSSSVSAFGLLQCAIREQLEIQAEGTAFEARYSMKDEDGTGAPLSEVVELENFFRERDPSRRFADLRQVTSEGGKKSSIWTTVDVVERLKDEAELVMAERRLEELARERKKRLEIEKEIAKLSVQLEEISHQESVCIKSLSNKTLQTEYSSSTGGGSNGGDPKLSSSSTKTKAQMRASTSEKLPSRKSSLLDKSGSGRSFGKRLQNLRRYGCPAL